MKKRSRWLKIVLGLLLLVVVTLTVLLLNIDTIACSQINKALNRYLVAGGNLTSIDIQLLEGKVVLSGLVIHPPPGFEPHPLLSLNNLEVDVTPWALLSGKVVVEDLAIYGLSLNIVRDKKGRLSPLELMATRVPSPEPQPENQPIEEAPPWIPMVHAHAIQVEDVSFRLADRMLEKDWSASLKAGLKVEGLRIEDLLNLDILVERVDLKLNDILVDQPPGFSREPFLAVNRIEIASRDIDFKAFRVPATDVILDTLSVSLERNTDREINIINLTQSWLPAESISSSSTSAPPSAASVQSSDSGLKFPVVTVDNIQLKSISAQLLDSMDGQPWRAGFEGLDIQAKGATVEDLARQAISLASLDLDLKGVSVDQPPGYSETPLLSMDSLKLASQGMDLGASEVTFSDVLLDTLNVSLERNADQEINLMKIAESWLPAAAEGSDKKPEPVVAAADASGPAFVLPAIVMGNAQIKSVSAQVLDSIKGKPWRAGFDGLDIRVKGVEVGDLAQQAIALASFDLNMHGITVDQPPGFSDTPLLSMGSLKLASQGMDLGASEVTFSDVLLDTLNVSLERNADREVNLLKLTESWLPAKDENDSETQVASSATPTESSGPVFEIPAVVVDNIQLNSISAQMLASIDNQPWRVGFDNLDIHVTGVDAGTAAEQAISLASFDLDLKGIKVDQPPGFDNRKLFGLEQFTVISEKTVGLGQELVIKEAKLQGLTSSLIMRSDGVTNLQVLIEALRDTDEAARPSKEEKGAERGTPSAKLDLQPVLLEHIMLNGGPVVYRDIVSAEESLEAYFDKIKMDIKGLRLFSDQKDVKPASASISFELEQPGELPTAYFGTVADVGPIGNGVPMVNTQVRLAGLKLDTLGSLVPKATRTALGASGLDMGAALAIDADSINLNASVLTDRNIRYEGITVQGPLNKPVVKIGPVMAGVFDRVADGLGNLGIDVLGSTVSIAEGGVDTALELGSGAAKVGVNLGKSLFDTTVGLLTLQKEKVKEGVSGSTTGTVDITKNSVKKSGNVAGDSLKRSGTGLKGQERIDAWDQEIPNRYQEYMQHAHNVLADMPYPPVTE